jgi:hypothetical protein
MLLKYLITTLNQKAPSTPLQGCGALFSFIDPASKPIRARPGVFQLILEFNLI